MNHFLSCTRSYKLPAIVFYRRLLRYARGWLFAIPHFAVRRSKRKSERVVDGRGENNEIGYKMNFITVLFPILVEVIDS
jgi:hypothetical protein